MIVNIDSSASSHVVICHSFRLRRTVATVANCCGIDCKS